MPPPSTRSSPRPDTKPNLTWLYDPNKLGAGFGSLLDDYAGRTRPFTDTAEFPEIARDADIIVIHKENLPPEAIADTPKLRAMLHLGQDYRGVPSDALRARQIPVAATPLVNYIAVAEHVWAFILNHVKKLPGQRRQMDARAYVDSWGLFPGTENVRDLTLGLLGFGEIARPIAQVARAFDMRTLYWDIRRFPDLEEQYGVEYVAWDELFAQADVLSVQLALNPQTHGIIGASELAKLKPNGSLHQHRPGQAHRSTRPGRCRPLPPDRRPRPRRLRRRTPPPRRSPAWPSTPTRPTTSPSHPTPPGKAPGPGFATPRPSGTTPSAPSKENPCATKS